MLHSIKLSCQFSIDLLTVVFLFILNLAAVVMDKQLDQVVRFVRISLFAFAAIPECLSSFTHHRFIALRRRLLPDLDLKATVLLT